MECNQKGEEYGRKSLAPWLGSSRLTLIAQGHACSCPAAVSTELHEEVSARAEQALNGQVFHLIGVVHRRGLHVISVADDEPGPEERQLCGCYPPNRLPRPPRQDSPSPVVIFCQGDLFKVQVQPLALRSL